MFLGMLYWRAERLCGWRSEWWFIVLG